MPENAENAKRAPEGPHAIRYADSSGSVTERQYVDVEVVTVVLDGARRPLVVARRVLEALARAVRVAGLAGRVVGLLAVDTGVRRRAVGVGEAVRP